MVFENRYMIFDIETTGLDPLFSRITCICGRFSDSRETIELAGDDEKEILLSFIKTLQLNDKLSLRLISANGKGFDIPFIITRCYLNEIPYSEVSFLLKKNHFDIINDITDKRISLNNLARLFSLNLKTGNGFHAIQLFKDGKFLELREYCMNDVDLTENIYLQFLKIKEEVWKKKYDDLRGGKNEQKSF